MLRLGLKKSLSNPVLEGFIDSTFKNMVLLDESKSNMRAYFLEILYVSLMWICKVVKVARKCALNIVGIDQTRWMKMDLVVMLNAILKNAIMIKVIVLNP